MSASLVMWIPLAPLLVAIVLGGLQLAGICQGERWEYRSSRLTLLAIAGACLAAMLQWGLIHQGSELAGVHGYGVWLHSGRWQLQWQLLADEWHLALAGLWAGLLLIAARFAVHYLHREVGFHRLFAFLALLTGAMMLIVLSANVWLTFIGWELAGLSSYVLIAFAYDRPVAAANASRVFLTNRLGDAGLLVLMIGALAWLESCEWSVLNQQAVELEGLHRNLLALCLVLAAAVKSVQLPFTPWLTRAMEGPTPTSAVFYGGVMIHAGVFLLIQGQNLLEQAPVVMIFITVLGGLTFLYSLLVGLTQTDVKTAQGVATVGQLGLMFVSCGLGYWTLATWHMAAHSVVRTFLMLSAPGILHDSLGQPVRPVSARWVKWRGLYLLSLQRVWLDEATDWLVVKPILRLARDMTVLERKLIAPLLAAPVPLIQHIAALAEQEERKIGANLHSTADSFAQGSGLAGRLTEWAAAVSHYFEYHFILHGIGRDSIRLGRRLGYIANRFEQLLLKPRYIILFVLISLLIVLGN